MINGEWKASSAGCIPKTDITASVADKYVAEVPVTATTPFIPAQNAGNQNKICCI